MGRQAFNNQRSEQTYIYTNLAYRLISFIQIFMVCGAVSSPPK